MSIIASQLERDAWNRNRMRTKEASEGLGRVMRDLYAADKDTPEPIVEALRRAEAAIAEAHKGSGK